MNRMAFGGVSLILLWCAGAQLPFAVPLGAAEAQGPLRVHPANHRYFTDGTATADGTLRAVYLTGSHTWTNLVDMGVGYPPDALDFDAHLEFLAGHHHNFVRMWAWDSTTLDARTTRLRTDGVLLHAAPHPWARTGPGQALDGRPKFDLTAYEPEYFERMRSRVAAAGKRGIYVSVMLFEGWGLHHGNRRRAAWDGWAWRSHPFHPDNNVNGVDATRKGDPISGDVHRLGNPRVNEIQAAYIRQVVDTVNDLDNVLYEVINEGGEKEWNWWVIRTIHEYERTKPKQHPVGNTGHGAERLDSMLASPAEWISPGRNDGYGDDPPAWHDKKVSVLDTDHIWYGFSGDPAWVWRSFLRGHNPIFMDPYDGVVLGTNDQRCEQIRIRMGLTRRVAERIGLAALAPDPQIASTGYCLANPGQEYLVYQPAVGPFEVTLTTGSYQVEWIDPAKGSVAKGDAITVETGKCSFAAPFAGEAVMHLKAQP